MLKNFCDGWTRRPHIYNGDGKLRNMSTAGGYLVVLCPDCFNVYRESKIQELRQEIGPMEPGQVGCEKCNRVVRQESA